MNDGCYSGGFKKIHPNESFFWAKTEDTSRKRYVPLITDGYLVGRSTERVAKCTREILLA